MFKKLTEPFDIEVKRFYLPFEIEFKCPHCNAKLLHDFEQEYLSYPTLNKFEEVWLYCDECDEESVFDAKLTISIDYTIIRKSKEK